MLKTNNCLRFPSGSTAPAEAAESKLRLKVQVTNIGKISVVNCSGRIVYREEATALSSSIMTLSPRPDCIVLDLSGVAAMDSAGLGELVVLYMWADAFGCQIKLAGAGDCIRQMLELTNLSSVFSMYASSAQAIESFRNRVA